MRVMRSDRKRELREFANRILAEAHSLGISLEEVIEELETKLDDKPTAANRQ
jgi:DNA-binding transcriptional regulator YhcF (GntR family)